MAVTSRRRKLGVHITLSCSFGPNALESDASWNGLLTIAAGTSLELSSVWGIAIAIMPLSWVWLGRQGRRGTSRGSKTATLERSNLFIGLPKDILTAKSGDGLILYPTVA